MNILGFSGALVASNLMDKQGRKNLLIGSYLGMVCSISSVQLFRKFYTIVGKNYLHLFFCWRVYGEYIPFMPISLS
jgi:hypothetical protein